MPTQRWQDLAESLIRQLGISLSEEQSDVFFDSARHKIVAGGEGGGKSTLGSLTVLCRSAYDVLMYERSDLYWIMGADFEDARREFDYLIDWETTLGWLKDESISSPTRREKKCVAFLQSGQRIETISAYDPRKVGRDEPIGIVGCEISRWDVEVWRRAYGRLARHYPRSWGIFTGSPDAKSPWFDELWELGQGPNSLDIKSFSLPSWANPVCYPNGRDDPAIKQLEQSMPAERFIERHCGRPVPPQDAMFPEFKHYLHVQNLELEESPVYIFVDPGDVVYCVLFVQFVGDEIRVVDEVYAHHWSHEQVVQACQFKPAWRLKSHKGHVIDVAGEQHHFGFGSPTEAWFRDTGIAFSSRKLPLEASIERLRQALSINPITLRPRTLISPKCSGLISEMGGGPSPIPGGGQWRQRGEKTIGRRDACMALAYGLIHHYGFVHQQDEDDYPQGYSYLERSNEARHFTATI